MSTFKHSEAFGRRLILAAIGVVFSTSMLAAEPVSDSQQLARQFILGKFASGLEASPGAQAPKSTLTRSTVRVDPQEYVRQFILGAPNVEFVASSEHVTGFVPAPGNSHVDPQEQVRRFILGTPTPADLSAATAAAPTTAARNHR